MMKAVVFLATFVVYASASNVINFKPSLPTGRIVKGQDAVEHAAPYIVSLSSRAERHSHSCGGTIIAKDWIVTAAHCISRPVGMGVVAGLHERANFTEKTQSRVVDFGLTHKNFGGGVGPYDIALLHVSEPFVYNEFVQAAILPQREEIHFGEAKLYGWGQVKAFNFNAAKVLQTVTTELIEYSDCEETLGEDTALQPSNVCSDSLQKGISACNGDSGGPLVQERKGVASELVGIVSWGYIPCGYGNRPSIYTRVSAYIDWIAQVQSAYYILN